MFWVAAGLLALAVAGFLVVSALAQGAAPEGPAVARIHTDQLREIERDAARGVIAPDEAQRMRAEVARRLIAAARPGAAGEAPARGPRALAAGLAMAAVLGGGAGLYAVLGAPGTADLPMAARLARAEALREARPNQAASEAAVPAPAPPQVDPDFLILMDQLRARVAGRPDDLQGHLLLAENEARLGNYAAAARAQAEVIRIRGAGVTAADHVLYARLMIAAAGGVISPEAEAALRKALEINPDDDSALFLTGLSDLRLGRPDLGFAAWSRLIETAPADSPWRPEALQGIGDVAAAAGVDYTPPAGMTLPGPDAGTVAAAEAMTPEDRAKMVRGMVDGLAARLDAEGGSAAEWARLVTSLATLGETARAQAVRDRALGLFAGKEDDLAVIRKAAADAGLAP